ncbi:putative oligosaccharyl transferase subunit [Trypanosoma theileri]|uniref:dolichyl-diphosphooligosaccharide--protein glycotransferase n=1 Tax=Trypanosoma theileri TaxID=67003 RepID=A0A1X0NFU7_9TRYP|nr:putative oligosaccharyl transferase subunit [Trypanosoma theileri]ORC83343.1 putative oligosaccharyl transferase subunit [Trypanosoma theileri]
MSKPNVADTESGEKPRVSKGNNTNKLPKTEKAEVSSTTSAATSGGTVYFWGLLPFPTRMLNYVHFSIFMALTLLSIWKAYSIRLISVQIYGKVIHEFDPWFNYRATEYLNEHGWRAFFEWYDYMSWYPLGRPVGTTIYPGLQITSVVIHYVLNAIGIPMSLNDVCVYVPAWFGSVATAIVALLSYETSGSLAATGLAAALFAISPAHLMRSMAGEYDNECIALAAMVLTFYMWVRSLRTEKSWPIGVLTGLAYGYMVSTWGGYIFVLNMVALHAAVCVLVDWMRGVYDTNLLKAYSLFFVVGTAIATRVPPVGWTPFRSLEQLMALLVFVFMWALHFSEIVRLRAGVSIRSAKSLQIRARAFMVTLGALVLIALLLAPQGYFGPLSSRVRALFVQHTRTGNPLVDSVAEHRPTSADSYWNFLHICYPLWFLGIILIVVFPESPMRRASSFFVCYSFTALYFSGRMSRLLLLAGPVATVCAAVPIGFMLNFALRQLFWEGGESTATATATTDSARTRGSKTSKKSKRGQSDENVESIVQVEIERRLNAMPRTIRISLSVLIFVTLLFNPAISSYSTVAERMAYGMSNPRIMFYAKSSRGETVLIDDYYASYMWLRNNTPADARVLAWWDYGYQITGIGNRTSLADGNTWNHEHIATIGKLLTSPVKESHTLIRHLADYVLIWAGQRGDDLMKSPHMARIGNSVYRDICPVDDPLCSNFGFYDSDFNRPTPMMQKSLLYNLHGHGSVPGVYVDEKLFQLVHVSRYGLVKIYKVMNVSQESKEWVANPKNRKCSPPGSWLCAGQYPPAKEIQDLLAKRIDYAQLEDFNRGKRDDEYYRAYMKRIREEAD